MPDPTSILLLGGSPTEAARLRRTLARHCLLVDVAQDFDEARALTARCTFHVLVLVDPPQSWEQLQAACSACDGLPSTILLIVPQGRAENAVAALRGGADDVLLRPFSTVELVASVKALGKRRPDARDDDDAAVEAIDEAAHSGDEARGEPPGYPGDWTLEQVKHHHMMRILGASDGNKSAAARRLGISRKTLERKLRDNNPNEGAE